MMKQKAKQARRVRRKRRVRANVVGTKKRPRLSIFRSNTSLYVQLIDDSISKTLVSAHSREIKIGKSEKKDEAKLSKGLQVGLELGRLVAKKAKTKKISSVVFDRGGYKYHGRVKAVADGAREGGLKF